jgi:hypothetical protein
MPKGRLAVGIGVAVVVAVAVFLLIDREDTEGGSDRSKQARPEARGPVVVTLDSLRALAGSVGHPIYWAGKQPGDYELTVDSNGNIFIRYLQAGEPAGSRRTSLTVATYPFAKGYEILRGVSRGSEETSGHTPDGGLVVVGKVKPNNAYIAYPGTDLQIEVYDPKAGRAFELATAGAISRIN